MSSDEQISLAPERLEAQRENASKSTGPRTPAGKARVARNALKHGEYAARHPSFTRSLYTSMQELGEDPEEFSRVQEALISSFHPKTPAETMLVEDIAMLRWRRRRLERAQAALVARRVQELEVERQRKSLQVSREIDAEIPASQLNLGLFWDTDSPTKFHKILEFLEGLKERLEAKEFSDAETLLGWVYGPNPTTRGALIKGMFRALAEPRANLSADSPQVAALRRQLLREISSITQLYNLYLRENVEFSPIMWDECLVPKKSQRFMLRELSLIDSGIERKTTLLLRIQSAGRGGKRRSAAKSVPGSRLITRPKIDRNA